MWISLRSPAISARTSSGSDFALARLPAVQRFDRRGKRLGAAIAERLARLARRVQLDEADPRRRRLGAQEREEGLEDLACLARAAVSIDRPSAARVGSTSSEAAAARHSALLAKCS